MRLRKGERPICDKLWADMADLESPSVVSAMLQRQLSEPVPGRVSSTFEAIAENRLLIKSHVESRCELPGIARSTFLMVFSPDGKKIASTHGNHCVYITDVKTGKNLNILSGHPRTPWCIAFHPSSNQILATGCLGGQVRVWDLHGGSEVWMTRGETVIASLAFHPVDHMLVIATYNELYFWDWSKPAPFAKCHTANEKEKVRYVSFDESGHSLVTGISNMQPQVTQWDRGGPEDWSAPAGRTQDDSGQGRTLTAQLRALLAHYEHLMEHQTSPRSPSLVDQGTDPMEVEQGTRAIGTSSPTGCSQVPSRSCPLHSTSIHRVSSLENLVLRGRRFRDTVMDFYNITREADDIMFQLRRQELPNFNVGLDLENTLRSVGLSVEAVRSSLAYRGQAAEEVTAASGNVENRSGGEQSEGSTAASEQFRGSGSRDQDACPSHAQFEFRRLEEISFGPNRLTVASRMRRSETELITLRRCLSQTAYILEQASRLRGENAYTGNHRRQLLSILVNSFRDIGQRDPTRRYYHLTASTSLASVGREASLAMGWPVETALWDNTHGGLISENLASILMPVGDTSSEDEEPAIRFVQVALRDYVEKLIVNLSNELSVLMPGPNALSQRMDQELIAIQANLHRMRTLYVRSSLIRDSFRSEASSSQSSGDGHNIILLRIDKAANEISAVRSKKGVYKVNETASPYVFNHGLFERLRTIFGPVSQNTNESSENSNIESRTPTPGQSVVPGEEDENNVGSGSEDVGSSYTCDTTTTQSRFKETGASEQSCKPSHSAEPLAASLAESRYVDEEMLPMESNVQIVGSGPGDGNIEESIEDTTPSVQGEQAVHQSQAEHSSEISSRKNYVNMVVLDILEETEMLVKLLNLVRSVVVKMIRICDQVPSSSVSSSVVVVVEEGGGSPTIKSSYAGEARPSASSVPSSPGFDLRARALSADQDAANLISKISNWKSLHLSQSCNVTSSHEVEVLRAKAMFELSLINFEVKSVANKIHELFSMHSRILGVCMLSHWGYAVDTARLNVMAMFDKLKRMTLVNPEHDVGSSIDATGLVPNPPMDDAAIEQEISKLNDKINVWIASRYGGISHSGPSCTPSELGEGTSISVGTSSTQSTSCPAEEKQVHSMRSSTGAPAKQNPSFTSKQHKVMNDRLQTALAEEDPGTSQVQAEEHSTEQMPECSHRGGWTYFPRRLRMEERFYVSPRSAFQPHVRRMQPGGEEDSGALSRVEQSIDRLSCNLENTLRLCRARLEVLELYQLQNLWEDLRGHIRSLQDRVHALRETSHQRGNPSVSQRPCGNSLAKSVAAKHTGIKKHAGMAAEEHTGQKHTGMVAEEHRGAAMDEHEGMMTEEDAIMERDEHVGTAVKEHVGTAAEEHKDTVMDEHADAVTGQHSDLAMEKHADLEMEEHTDLVMEENVDSVIEEHVDSLAEEQHRSLEAEEELADSAAEEEHLATTTDEHVGTAISFPQSPASIPLSSTNDYTDVAGGSTQQSVKQTMNLSHSTISCRGTMQGNGSNIAQHLRSVMSRMNRRLSMSRHHFSVGTRSLDSRHGAASQRRTCGLLRVQTYLLKLCANRGNKTGGRRLCGGIRGMKRRWEDTSAPRPPTAAPSPPPPPLPVEEANRSSTQGGRRLCGGIRGMKRTWEDTSALRPSTVAPPPPPPPPPPIEEANRSSSQQPQGTMMGRLEALVARHNEQQLRFQRQITRLRTVTATDRDVYNLLQVALQITGALLSQLVRSNHRVEASEEDRQQVGGAQHQRTFMVPSVRVNDVPVSEEAAPCSPPLRRLSRLDSPPLPLAQRFQHFYGDSSSPYVRPRFLHPRYVAWPDPFSSDPDNPYLGPPVIVRDLASPQTHRIQVWDFSQFHIPDISRVDKNVVVTECKIHNDASVDISRDGSMLVALLPSDHYENVTNTLGVYSLLPQSRGQCLYTTNFEQNAVSVSFSPTGHHLLIGVAINRATLLTTDSNFLARIYRLSGARDGIKGHMFRVRNFERTREHAYMSVNCIRWLPAAGQGFVYGTNTGQLRILR